jgi:hypothetical protein
MSLSCDLDERHFVEIGEMTTSVGTEFCYECYRLIPKGELLYPMHSWNEDEEGYERVLERYKCCSDCGDLILSVFEMGLCWERGSLRQDLKEYVNGDY